MQYTSEPGRGDSIMIVDGAGLCPTGLHALLTAMSLLESMLSRHPGPFEFIDVEPYRWSTGEIVGMRFTIAPPTVPARGEV